MEQMANERMCFNNHRHLIYQTHTQERNGGGNQLTYFFKKKKSLIHVLYIFYCGYTITVVISSYQSTFLSLYSLSSSIKFIQNHFLSNGHAYTYHFQTFSTTTKSPLKQL